MMATVRLNPRQRRGVVLLALAAVGAVGVFLSVQSYVAEVRSEVGPRATAWLLVTDIPAYDGIPPEAVEPVAVPVRWLPETAVTDDVVDGGLVASADLSAGSLLQADMLTEAPDVGPGERAATLTLPRADVSPGIDRGDRVDVLGAFGSRQQGDPARVAVIVESGLVLARESVATGAGDDVQLVFALPAGDALELGYAQSYAERVSVVAVGADSPPLGAGELTYTNDDVDPPGGAAPPDGAAQPDVPVGPE